MLEHAVARSRVRTGQWVVVAAAVVAMLALLAGTASGRVLSGRDPGVYPADRTLEPADVVRSYVDAINRRDGARFCGLVATWVSGRFDLWGNDPDSPVLKPIDCPQIVRGMIGYIEDCCPPEFVRHEIVRLGPLETDGGLRRVEMEIRTHVKEDKQPKTIPLQDVVWLVRDRGAWRIAKLGVIAAWASLASGSAAELAGRPDVAAERRRFVSEVAAFKRRQREREASYQRTLDSMRCPTKLTVPDPPRDMTDWIHTRPPHRSSIAHVRRADLRSFSLGRSGMTLCMRFETGGGIRGPSRFTFSISDQHGDETFSQGFEVDLRADGRARVTSGVDADRRPIVVPAKVALSGRTLTLRVDRHAFAVGEPYPISKGRPSLDRFVFGVGLYVRLSTRRETSDSLGIPNHTFFTYPTGKS